MLFWTKKAVKQAWYLNTGNFCIKALAVADIVSIHEGGLLDHQFRIEQNAPNPFANTTYFRYTLNVDAMVKLSIMDINGRVIDEVINTYQSAGEHSVRWEAANNNDGLYFYNFNINGKSEGGRMIIMR
ncbi:MAG: T9SS type A sorting domain-containing protein [Bacteroidota bacterium]